MALATRLGGEIVAVDSMTLFQGMDIGTAKPSHADRESVPHHLIDILAPTDSSNVADWLDRCRRSLACILGRGRVPVLTGGTGLYWKALFFGLPAHPPGNALVREKWFKIMRELGAEAVHRKLSEVDPASGLRIPPTDAKRMIRALEVWEVTGNPISANRPDWRAPMDIQPDPPARWIWLKWPRSLLHDRIARRVVRMFAQGWEAEVASLERRNGFGPQSEAALGYRTIRQASKEGESRDEIIRRVTVETRQYAKRQETWFRSLPAIQPIQMDSEMVVESLLDSLVRF